MRTYTDDPLTLAELSRLLFYTGGINAERFGVRLRAAPSAGALYPIETYLAVHRVSDLRSGVYHYGVADHTLALLREGDVRGAAVRQGLMQEFLGACNLVVYFTVILHACAGATRNAPVAMRCSKQDTWRRTSISWRHRSAWEYAPSAPSWMTRSTRCSA